MVNYLAFFDVIENKNKNRDTTPSAVTKLKYIFECFEKNNIPCSIISKSGTLNKNPVGAEKIEISKNITLDLPFSLGRKNRAIKVLDRWQINIVTLFKLLKLKKYDTLVVYHSTAQMKIVAIAKKIKNFKLVIEVEEIYGDVKKDKKLTIKEEKYFNLADAYIFSTEYLNDRINKSNKPYCIIYGTYQVEEDKGCIFNDDKTHIVYAGTFDIEKGVLTSINSAKYLNSDYHLHIIGFGSETNKQKVKNAIRDISFKTECEVSYDGLLSGEDYIRFLQSCDIGLSTQNLNAQFNDTSFPSKVLSYMANGLRVVSVRIPTLERSKIGEFLYFYDLNEPKEVAKAIMNIDMNDEYDSKAVLENLDKKFVSDLARILN